MSYTTQEEYLLELSEKLKYLPLKEQTKILRFYQDKINTALDYNEEEAKVIESLPSPDEVAEGAYNAKGFKYKELLIRKSKISNIFSIIFNIILFILSTSLLIVLIALGIRYIEYIGSLLSLFIKQDVLLDKVINIMIIVSISSIFIIVSLFVIDTYYTFSLYLALKCKIVNEDKEEKILKYSIISLIDKLFKHDKICLKVLLTSIFVLLILSISSFVTSGYVKHCVFNTPNNKSTINIDQVIASINIDAIDTNVSIVATDSSSIVIDYCYELSDNMSFDIEGDSLVISEKEKTYNKVFHLLKEPTPQLTIYIPNDYSMLSCFISLNKGSVSLDKVKLNSISVDSSDLVVFSVIDSSVNNIELVSSFINLGLVNSTVTTISGNSLNQLVIQDNSNIGDITLLESSGKIKCTDSAINNFTINHKTSRMDIINMNISSLSLDASSCETYFKDSFIDNSIVVLKDSAIIDFVRVYGNNLSSIIKDSYFTSSYLSIAKMLINDSFNNNIYLNFIGKSSDNTSDLYNQFILDNPLNVSISTNGESSKTYISDSNINDLLINQDKGFIILDDSIIDNSIINATMVDSISITNVDGILMDLRLTKIKSFTEFKSQKTLNIIYKITKFDEASMACVIAKDDNVASKVIFDQGDNND